jgi:glycosyltransferase involved in cell wall biosynthesis
VVRVLSQAEGTQGGTVRSQRELGASGGEVKVLILHSRYLTGAASGENRVVEDEARLLRRGGHAVTVWDPSPDGATGAGLASTAGRAVWSARASAEVVRLVREQGAQVVHCHNLFPMLSPSVLRAAAREGAGVVMTLHNYRLLCLPATFLREDQVCEACLGRLPWRGVVHGCYRGSRLASATLAASIALHRAAGSFESVRLYLAVSEFVRNKHVEAGWPAERVRVKPSFAWESPRREGPGEYFLYLGRLSAEKGAETAVESWRGAAGRLIVVGDGPERGRLQRIAPAGVEFRPPVSSAEVPGLLAGARALLVPSVCYEGAPRAILEAYAAGVPVLASRTGGVPELVVDGESGFLLPMRAPEAWAEATNRLADDREARRLGEGAWRLWQERYTPELGLRQLEDAYRRVAGAS